MRRYSRSSQHKGVFRRRWEVKRRRRWIGTSAAVPPVTPTRRRYVSHV